MSFDEQEQNEVDEEELDNDDEDDCCNTDEESNNTISGMAEDNFRFLLHRHHLDPEVTVLSRRAPIEGAIPNHPSSQLLRTPATPAATSAPDCKNNLMSIL